MVFNASYDTVIDVTPSGYLVINQDNFIKHDQTVLLSPEHVAYLANNLDTILALIEERWNSDNDKGAA